MPEMANELAPEALSDAEALGEEAVPDASEPEPELAPSEPAELLPLKTRRSSAHKLEGGIAAQQGHVRRGAGGRRPAGGLGRA